MKKLIIFLMLVLITGICSCAQAQSTEETALEVWNSYLLMQESMIVSKHNAYVMMDHALENPTWENILLARYAGSGAALIAKNITPPADLLQIKDYVSMTAKGADMEAIGHGIASARSEIDMFAENMNMYQQYMHDEFLNVHYQEYVKAWLENQKKHLELQMAYLRYTTNYMLLQAYSAQEAEEKWAGMDAEYPRIMENRDVFIADAEQVEKLCTQTLDELDALYNSEHEASALYQYADEVYIGAMKAGEYDKIREDSAQMYNVPAIGYMPSWMCGPDSMEAVYYTVGEDGKKQFDFVGENGFIVPDHVMFTVKNVSRQDVLDYISDVEKIGFLYAGEENEETNRLDYYILPEEITVPCGYLVSWENDTAQVFFSDGIALLLPIEYYIQ